MNISLISAVLPVLVILYFIYSKDKYNKEPVKKLLGAFLVGCLSVIPAGLQEALLEMGKPSMPVIGAIYEGFVVAGFSEELWKLLLLYLVVWRSQHFDEYFDGIVYAVFLSMGFACIENIGYVFSSDSPLHIATMRGLLAVPAHFLFAVVMGYHFSLAKFDPSGRGIHLLHALLYPMLMHGTYDALLMVSDAIGEESLFSIVLFVIFIIFDIRMWRWGLRRIKLLQERSKEQNFDHLHPFDGFTWNV